jgi:hypothetical protein
MDVVDAHKGPSYIQYVGYVSSLTVIEWLVW